MTALRVFDDAAGLGVALAAEIATRRDNLATFHDFRSLDEVPSCRVTVGIGTIARARRHRLILHRAGKRAATMRLLSLDRFDPGWPASIVHDCPGAEVWAGKEALP